MAVTGRPAVYSTPDLMAQAIDLYLATCEAEKKSPTVTRMALALGFESRQSFYDYENKPDFSYIIKTARLHVEAGYEDGLRENNCTGSIFALKNMGWKDKTEAEVYGKDGKAIVTETHVKIIRDKATGITPGEFTPQPASSTESKETV